MSFIIPPPFRIELPEQLLLSDSITGARSGVAASEKAVGLVNKRIPEVSSAFNGTRSDVAASEEALGIIHDRMVTVSNRTNGTRFDVAASEKALGLVNKRIPEADLAGDIRYLRDGGAIAFGYIAPGNRDLRFEYNLNGLRSNDFSSDSRTAWGIITLEINTQRRPNHVGQDDFSIALMSLNQSQLNAPVPKSLLLSNTHTFRYDFYFKQSKPQPKTITLMLKGSMNKLIIYDSTYGLSIKVLQEMVIK